MATIPGEYVPRLDEFSKEEWRDIAKLLDKNYSDEKFDTDWDFFIALKKELADVQGRA